MVVVRARLQFPSAGWTAEARWHREGDVLVVELLGKGPGPDKVAATVISRPTLNFDVAAGQDVRSLRVVGANGARMLSV